MFFRALTFFRFPELALDALEAGLAECALREPGPMELATRGFISPFGRDTEGLKYELDGAIWLAIGGRTKLIPAAVVNDLLAKKLDEIEKQEGRRPGGRTRKRLKDELITDLLPKALVQPSRLDLILDSKHGIVAVDTPSKKAAENAVSEVRRALGSFPALPINAEVAPRSVMTAWLAGEALPEGLALGDECELRDALDQGGIARLKRMELRESPEVDKHLQAGKQCTALALTWRDHVSFVLGEDLTLRKFKLLDGAAATLENTEREDIRAELESRFALMAHEARDVFAVIERALKLSRLDGEPRTQHFPAGDVGVGDYAATEQFAKDSPGGDDAAADDSVMFAKALAHVVDGGRPSITAIQRVLKVGYNRGARLLEALVKHGAVEGPDFKGEYRTLPRAVELAASIGMTAKMRAAGFEDVTVEVSLGRR